MSNGKITSSSALIRSSVNPDCDLVAAIALEQQSEKKVYKDITGHDYAGEYGIRLSLQRRGLKFEKENHRNDAAPLREKIAEALGLASSEDVLVRDLDIQEPTTGGDTHASNLRRYKTTQKIIHDAYVGKAVPHLVIHPTFELSLLKGPNGKPLMHGALYFNPDFMVLWPGTRIYLIGDEKSFIVRDDTVVDPGKLDQVRRQIAVGTLAMRAEIRQKFPQNTELVDEGLLIFATPYGMKPARMKREGLAGEIDAVQRAIPQMQRVAVELARIRASGLHQFAAIAPTLNTNLRESCYGRCIMVDYCEKQPGNQNGALGRDVERLLGGKTAAELLALAAQRAGIAPRDEALLSKIEQNAAILGIDLISYLKAVA